jgi:hypothetical protein
MGNGRLGNLRTDSCQLSTRAAAQSALHCGRLTTWSHSTQPRPALLFSLIWLILVWLSLLAANAATKVPATKQLPELDARVMSNDQPIFIDGVGEERGQSFDTQTALFPDGTRVTRLNIASPVVIYNFSYEDKRIRFRFLASRWGDDRRPQDTWDVVFLHELTDASSPFKELDDAALQNIAGKIRTALLAWPPLKAEAIVKLVHVEFRLRGWLLSRAANFLSRE